MGFNDRDCKTVSKCVSGFLPTSAVTTKINYKIIRVTIKDSRYHICLHMHILFLEVICYTSVCMDHPVIIPDTAAIQFTIELLNAISLRKRGHEKECDIIAYLSLQILKQAKLCIAMN